METYRPPSVTVGFKRKVNGMPNLGQGRGWTAASWRRAPRKRIQIEQLISTNKSSRG